jgi:hypothetical protein
MAEGQDDDAQTEERILDLFDTCLAEGLLSERDHAAAREWVIRRIGLYRAMSELGLLKDM